MNRTDLDAADILAACMTYVPVNALVDHAIAAHRTAFLTLQDNPDDPEARQLAFHALRAVVLARTPAIEDYRVQLDYLTALPETAWPDSAEHSSGEYREATLDMIRRQIAWVTVCA